MGVGLLPLPTLLIWLAHLHSLRPLLRVRAIGRAQCLLPLLVVLELVVVALSMTVQALAMAALLILVLRVRIWGRGLRLLPVRLAQSIVVVLPPLLWVRLMTTVLVPSIPSICIRMISFSFFFFFFFCLIWEFHSLEELASVALKWCKTSLASVYGLQSESSPALHLPTSSLLCSILEDTNSVLSNFVEDQTVHGSLPVPRHRHRRYSRISSSSFPGPFSVPPGLALITLEHGSE